MATWDNRKQGQQGQVQRDMASQRLDCFLSIVYLFPNALEPRDVDLLAKRDTELTKIYRYGGYGFLGMYAFASFGSIVMKGRLPFFRQVVKHSILGTTGTFCSALICEKVAAELYYNQLMIQLADKYNFTPEEVMDLQRNLNQYYIKKEREEEISKA